MSHKRRAFGSVWDVSNWLTSRLAKSGERERETETERERERGTCPGYVEVSKIIDRGLETESFQIL